MTVHETAVLGRNLTDPSRAAHEDDLEAGLKPPVFDSIVVPEEFGPVDLLVDDLKVKRFAFTQDETTATGTCAPAPTAPASATPHCSPTTCCSCSP
jgi:hypothetical protein